MTRVTPLQSGFEVDDSTLSPGTVFRKIDGTLWKVNPDGTQSTLGDGGGAWGEASTASFSGSGSPVGNVTPDGEGDLYVDTDGPGLWQATGTADTDWEQVGGGGSLPAWLQSGDGSPVGSVAPSQKGALYQDTTNGALYTALGATDADWILLGGHGDDSVAGVWFYPAGNAINVEAANQVVITDPLGSSGTGNGIYWVAGDVDGTQAVFLQVGPSGEFTAKLLADGSFVLPTLPTSDPHVAGQLYTVTGVVHQSAG